MGHRLGHQRANGSRILFNVSCSFRLLLRPREAIRLITALGITGAVLALPANALISPTAPVGATPGSFAVSPSGAATYTIPIVIPPGINGMQPSLALVYNSQGGNGLIGMGWSLSGLSVIHRCPATVELDGFRRGVDYGINDRLCLDGQRLVSIGQNEYRTEEESLQRIVADNTSSPNSFVVYDKDGRVRQYGVTADSRIEAQGQTVVRVWALNLVRDRSGNEIAIRYYEDNANGDYRPLTITYGDNTVSLQYDNTRPDVVPMYQGGSVIRLGGRLTRILSHATTPGGSAELVREYRLAYDNAGVSGLSRLVSVQEFGTDGTALPPTRFTWTETPGGGGWQAAGGFNPPWQFVNDDGKGRGARFVDLNADGISDFVFHYRDDGNSSAGAYLSTGSGYTYVAAYAPPDPLNVGGGGKDAGASFEDLNGDRLPDFMYARTNNSGQLERSAYLNTGAGWQYAPNFLPPEPLADASGGDLGVRFVDLNGDGLVDFVFAHTLSDGTFYNGAYLNTGTQWQLAYQYAPEVDLSAYALPGKESGARFEDVNGDGLVDLLYASAGLTGALTSFAYLNTGNGWTSTADASTSPFRSPVPFIDPQGDQGVRLVDVNGDGLVDLLRRQQKSSGSHQAAYLNTGRGWTPANWLIPPADITGDDGDDLGWRFVDLNADGRPDLVNAIWRNGGLSSTAYLNTPSGWQAYGQYAPPHQIVRRKNSSSLDQGTRFADLNGDGLEDFAFARAEGGLITGAYTNTAVADRILNVVDGLGATTEVNYQPLTNGAVYIKDTGAVYPYQDVQGPVYVVSQSRATNGIGGMNTTTHRYGGLKNHYLASTLLGFRWMETLDPAGLVHYTYFNQNREAGIDGTIAQRETILPSLLQPPTIPRSAGLVRKSGTVKQVFNTWISANGVCGGRPQPQLSGTREITNELNGSFVSDITTANTYDGCGFATRTVVDMGGGHKKTTVNQYAHDTTNWHLGLVTRADVTSEAPGQTPLTRVVGFSYDSLGRLQTEVIEPDQPSLSLTTTYAYDNFGNRTSKTLSGPDIDTRSEFQTYDARGLFVASKTNAAGHTSSFQYDPRNGQPTRITDPNGLVTTMDYDGLGRKGIETRPDNTSTRFTYAATSTGYSIRTQTDGAGDVYTFHDILGRTIRTSTQAFGGNWIYQDTTYDALGRATQKTHPYFAGETIHATTYGYDLIGRVTRVTEAGNRTTLTDYNGLTTTVTNPLGQSKTTVKDVQGRTVSVTDNAGPVQYEYDAVGNLTQVTGVGGSTTAMQYDARGRKTAMQDPDMGSWTYTYDVLGQLKSQRDAKNQTISMTYDNLGRLLTKTTPEATSNFKYDTAPLGTTGRIPTFLPGGSRVALGKLAAATNSTDGYSEAYTYDNLGRTKTSTINTNYTVTYDYDAFSRVEYLTYPSTGFKVRNRYDAFGYLYQVTRVTGTTESLLWQTTASDAHARIIQEMYGNGLTTNRAYHHETGDLQTIQTGTGATPTSIQNLSYTFDAIDNLLARTDTLQALTETFTYDNVNRLTRATVQGSGINLSKTYSYNAAGNLTYKSDVGSYTYDRSRPHAVTQVQGIVNSSYTYDANGNQLSGGGRTITYTAFNKPKTITGANGTTTFYYDVNDNRFRKDTAQSTTLYIGKLYERVSRGSLTEHKHYVYGGNTLVATHTERNNGTPAETRYVHADHLDSINVITDANGNVVERLSFDPHGKRRNLNGSDATSPITSQINRGYTRHEHDDEVGLINMNARLYDPTIGRFITPDTLIPSAGDSQAYNRYSYVKNNPLSLVDPSGHSWLSKGFKRLFRSKAFRAVVAVAAYVFAPQIAAAATSAGTAVGISGTVAAGIAQGAITGYVLGGTAKSALLGGVSGGAFGAVGNTLTGAAWYERAFTHAVTGGLITGAVGGDVTGALLGGFTGTALGASITTPDPAAEFLLRSIAGGLAAKAGGGKFSTGAITAGYAYLFSEALRASSGPPGRELTTDEINAAKSVFGDRVDYSRVRVVDGKYVFFQGSGYVMAPNGSIYWPGECGNLATCGGGAYAGTFIHEMTHVMQHQHGVNVLGQGFLLQAGHRLSFGLYDPYSFTYDPSRSFSSYNIEQQGDIARGIYYGRYPNNIDY